MQKSINLLKQRIEVLNKELERLKNEEPEITSVFIDNDIANILSEISEHQKAIEILIKKTLIN